MLTREVIEKEIDKLDKLMDKYGEQHINYYVWNSAQKALRWAIGDATSPPTKVYGWTITRYRNE